MKNPDQLFTASIEMAPRLTRKSYSFHSILAQATFAHHLGIATGELDSSFLPSITDRQTAFMVRSGIMGLLINSSDTELAERYEQMVQTTPVLAVIEEWSFPTYTRNSSRPNSDFSLPGSILLRTRRRQKYCEKFTITRTLTCTTSAGHTCRWHLTRTQRSA